MQIIDAIDKLKKYRKKHFELGEQFLTAENGNLYPLDLLMIATLNRSVCLLKGFIEAIESRNFIVAASLIRLQLDNCLRLSAGSRVENADTFAMKILEGIPIKKQKDIFNNPMTDSYLLSKLPKEYAWLNDVYKDASGYIHLSEKHIFNALHSGESIGEIKLKITDVDAFVTENDYLETILLFQKITDVLFVYVDGWVFSKRYPEKAKEMFISQFKET
jgi:hypothetical protein